MIPIPFLLIKVIILLFLLLKFLLIFKILILLLSIKLPLLLLLTKLPLLTTALLIKLFKLWSLNLLAKSKLDFNKFSIIEIKTFVDYFKLLFWFTIFELNWESKWQLKYEVE